MVKDKSMVKDKQFLLSYVVTHVETNTQLVLMNIYNPKGQTS